MTLETLSRKYSDNLRKFRRDLQGRGVNIRETIVSANAYADTRITVPGLHDGDVIISVLNLTDLLDVTGDLDDGGEVATHEFGSADSRFTVTALKKGTGGNKIALKAVTGTGTSSPLAVQIGDRDTLFSDTGHPGWTGILVTLATNSGGTLDTTDNDAAAANSAQSVRTAILDAQEVGVGEGIVDVTIDNGDGTDHVGTISATALTGGTAFKQGPSRASYVTEFVDPYADGNVRYVAAQAGAEGNDITVAYTAGGALAVGVTGEAITVTYVVGVTTAQDVVDAVNADADAAALVRASLASADAPDGLVETLAQTNLAGGADPGIQFSAATDTPLSAKTLKVLWLTRNERDEMPAQ